MRIRGDSGDKARGPVSGASLYPLFTSPTLGECARLLFASVLRMSVAGAPQWRWVLGRGGPLTVSSLLSLRSVAAALSVHLPNPEDGVELHFHFCWPLRFPLWY